MILTSFFFFCCGLTSVQSRSFDPEAVVSHVIHEKDLKRNVIRDSTKLWPEGIVYFSLDPDPAKNFDDLRPLIEQAIDIIQDKTCLIFLEVDWSSYGGDHIKMIKRNGCWSKMGRVGGGQSLSLGSGCKKRGIILRELLRSVGLGYEQNRPDRDEHVKINWANIVQGKGGKFKKYSANIVDTLGFEYDYDSIMHFPNYMYSVQPGKKKTIVALGSDGTTEEPWRQFGGEERGTLTHTDVQKINKLYNCNI